MSPHQNRLLRVLLSCCLGLWLTIALPAPVQPQTTIAQNPPETMPVVVDGKEVFAVEGTDSFTATQRADWINQHLAEILQTKEKPVVQLQQQNGLPILIANDRYLMTVIETDQSVTRDLQQQAEFWRTELQTAMDQAYLERRPQYLQEALLKSLIVISSGLLLARLLHRLCLDWLQAPLLQWCKQKGVLTEEEEQDDRLQQDITRWFKFLIRLLQMSLVLATVLYSTNLFPLSRQWTYRTIQALRISLTAPLLTVGDNRYAVTDLLILALLFGGILVGSSALTRLFKSQVLSLTRMNRGTQEVIITISRYCLIFFSTIALLQAWGLDLSSLALLGGALGVGIGFGLQDIARDFSSGLILLFERSVQAGDFIEVDNYSGTVERVGARSILLRTLDSVSIIVPNSKFIRDHVINWSHENPISRLRLAAPVAYGSDVQKVRSCLLQAAKEHPQVVDTPTPRVFFLGYGDNALNFELFIWIRDPSQQLPVTSDLYFRIEELFRLHQITVPFPQRDLHVQSGGLPMQFSPQVEQVLLRWLEQQSPPEREKD
ncbi:MAG: mechanosensitive ion channel family protein, partial [Prochlorotrichaceae cyanobacterium]